MSHLPDARSHDHRDAAPRHEGRRNLPGKCARQSSLFIDVGELGEFAHWGTLLLPRLDVDVGAFDVHCERTETYSPAAMAIAPAAPSTAARENATEP